MISGCPRCCSVRLQRLGDADAEEIDVEGLLHEVESARLHRLHCHADGRLSGDDQRGGGDALVAQLAHHLHAGHARQKVVGDDQIDAAARQGKSLLTVLGEEDLSVAVRQHLRQRAGLGAVVLDDEDADFLARSGPHQGAPGSTTVKVVPCPGWLSTRMSPPCCRTIWRLIERPSPVPLPLPVRKNGVKRRGRSCGERPGP